MAEKALALRLAAIFDGYLPAYNYEQVATDAAAELRRLHAEVERLRVDAERYRFIRDADRSDCITPALSLYAMESLDEYVDAAMEDEARAIERLARSETMGKCEHGLTSKECYVCASPKHGEQRKPEALRLADAMTAQVEVGGGDLTELEEAAAELRRLHVLNAELLEALKELTEVGAEAWGEDRPCVRIGLAAIAKATGEQP